MRESILNLLKKGKELHQDLIENYNGVLPKNIIANGSTTNEEFPDRTNTLIKILNMAEGKEKYSLVSNVDEAIELFENVEIQNSIDKAIANNSILGGHAPQQAPLSTEELLKGGRHKIEVGVNTLQDIIMIGKSQK